MGQSKNRDDQLFAAPCEFCEPVILGDIITVEDGIFPKAVDAFGGGIALGINDAAHTFKKYNKGAPWTPKVQDASFSNGEGVTYDIQVGTFTEIGNRVFFEAHIKLTSVGTLVSVINIVNFPVPMKIGSFAVIGVNQADGLNLAGAFNLTGRLDSASQSVRLQQQATNIGVSDVTPAQFSDTGEIRISGNYIAAEISATQGAFTASQTLDFILNTAVPGGTPDDVLTVEETPFVGFYETLAGDTVVRLDVSGKLRRVDDVGLYIFGLRRNFIPDSEDFTAWQKRGVPVVVDQAILAPDGSMTASTITVGATSVRDMFVNFNGFPPLTFMPLSFFIKRVSTTGILKFSKTTGGLMQLGDWSVDMALLPDEWERVTELHPAVTVIEAFRSNSSDTNQIGLFIHSDDATELTFDLWGVQMEQGDGSQDSTPPLPGGVSEYRKSDISVGFGGLVYVTQPVSQMGFGADEGMIVIEFTTPTLVAYDHYAFGMGDLTVNNDLSLAHLAGTWSLRHTVSGVVVTHPIVGIVKGTRQTIAVGWQADGKLNVSIDGGAVQTFDAASGLNFIPEDNFTLGGNATQVNASDAQLFDGIIQSLTSYADYSDALLQGRSIQIRS